MGKKCYNPRFMFGGTEWCNTDMACKILCEKRFPEKTEEKSIQATSVILRNAMFKGKIGVERERSFIAWNVGDVRAFANTYKGYSHRKAKKPVDRDDFKGETLKFSKAILAELANISSRFDLHIVSSDSKFKNIDNLLKSDFDKMTSVITEEICEKLKNDILPKITTKIYMDHDRAVQMAQDRAVQIISKNIEIALLPKIADEIKKILG